MTSVLLLLSVISSPRATARPQGDLAPPQHLCDLNQVYACEESERVAGLNSRAAGEALDPRIGALAPVVARVQADLDQARARKNSMAGVEMILKREISFIAKGEEAPSNEILPGFASPEDFFSLTPAEKTWQERYPNERAQALNAQLTQIPAQELACQAQMEEISTKFDGLNGQYQSLVSQRANLFADAQAHANMSNTGCHQRICPQ